MQLLASEELGGVVPEATEERWYARFVPETAAEERLLAAFIRQQITGLEWPLARLYGPDSEYVVKMRLNESVRGPHRFGIYLGSLETSLAKFDPVNLLAGESFEIEFWVEDATREPRVCWRMPKNALGDAQENYLPHRPVLFAE